MGIACVRCGQDLPTEARFCLLCGASIDGADPLGGPEALFHALAGASVGRDEELGLLTRSWDEVVRSGRPRVALLAGGQGAGKTKLARDLLDATGAPFRTLRCTDAAEAVGLGPLAELVLNLAGGDGPAQPDDLSARLAEVLDDEALAARLLGHVGLAPAVAGVEELPGDLAMVLRALGREAPFVLLVEDLDTATARLRSLLAGAVTSVLDAPVLVVVTCAEVEAAQSLPVDVALELGPLGATSVAELLVKALHGSVVVEELAVPVARAAAGSPFLLEQALALLVDAHALEWTGEDWKLHDVPGELPQGLESVLSARLGLLAGGERRALECAAVLGDDMKVGELLGLASGPQDTTTALAGLVGRQLLRRSADGQGYRFHHATLRAAAYRAVPKRRLAELHLRAADHFEHVAPVLRERIAVHLERAVALHAHLEPAAPLEPLARRAAQAWLELGRRALLVSELPAAARCLERGLHVAPPGSGERAALLQVLAEVRLEQGDAGAALPLSLEAGALAERTASEAVRLLADLCRLRAEAALGLQSPREVLAPMRACATRLEARREWERAPRAWLAVAEAARDACDWEAAGTAVSRATRRARETASADLGACLVRSASLAAEGPMPVGQAREVCRDAMRLLPAQTLASARCTASAALVAALDGREQEARELFDYALAVTRWRDVPAAVADVLVVGSRLAMVEGRPHDAVALLVEAAAQPPWPAAATAYARARAGDVTGARRALAGVAPAAEGAPESLGLQALEALVSAGLAESVLLRASDPVAAVTAAHGGVRLAAITGSPLLQGEAHRVLAEALTRVEAVHDARDALDAARDHYRAKGAQVLVEQLALDVVRH